MDMWHTVGPICVPVISETLVTKVLLQNELNNHLPLSGFIHQTTSGGVLTRGLFVCFTQAAGCDFTFEISV